MIDMAVAYGETQQHLAGLVRGLSADELSTTVPASPAWTVKDVVAHLTGLSGDVVAGRIPPELMEAWWNPQQAALRDSMTAAQVDARRGDSVDAVIEEWRENAAALLPMMRGERPFPKPWPFIGEILLTDAAVHAQDVRGTVGVPGDRESAGVGIGLAAYAVGLGYRLDRLGIPALRLAYDGKERIAGSGEPAATLAADRFEIFRALSGRRSTQQVRAMGWTGDPGPYLPLIPAYGERTDPITE